MTKPARLVPWVLIAALAMLLFGSTFHKALVASFTHDESFTYNRFVTAPLADIVSYKVVSSNNHLLNTLLMKTGARFFGPIPIVLRFPNILAHLGFLLFSLLLLRKLNPWMILPLFALLNCNPYLLDFFALARGNGLSYCFMMGSIWFFSRYAEKPETRYYAWSVVLAGFGVLSHFTMLYYLLSLIIVANLWPFLTRFVTGDRTSIKFSRFAGINLVNLVILLILGFILAGPVVKLVAADQFYYGGESGFWHDTVGSLVETFFYGTSLGPIPGILLRVLILLVVISTMVLFIYILVKKEERLLTENTLLFVVFVLLVLTIFINITQFYLLGTKLLIRRFGLLLDPMFMICLGYLFVCLFRAVKLKTVPFLLVYSLALAFAIYTFSAFSATTYLDWEYDQETNHVITILERDVQLNAPDQAITLGISWPFEPALNFYRSTKNLTWLNELTRDGPSVRAGYYYISRDDLAKVPLQGALPVILFDDGKTMLVRLKRDT